MSKKKPAQPVSRPLGYARVSTAEQNLEMQIDALKRYGVRDDDIHVEKVSGASDRRPRLKWLMDALRPGDTLVVYKIDRLGRTMSGLLKITEDLKEMGVRLVSIVESVDFETDSGTFMFYMLAMGAEMERRNTLKRTRDGVDRAMAAGTKFGQPPKLPDEKDRKQVAAWINGEGLTTREAVKRVRKVFGKKISPTTCAAYARQYRDQD